MREQGLIYKMIDSRDRRKKYFGLNTDLLVSSRLPVTTHYDKILQSIPGTVGDRYGFLKSLFHLVRSGIESYGVDTCPALKKIGRDVGKTLAPYFKAKTPDALLRDKNILRRLFSLFPDSPPEFP